MIKRIALLTAFAVLAFNAPAMACDEPCNPGGGGSCPGGNQIACDEPCNPGGGGSCPGGNQVACDDDDHNGGNHIACDDDHNCPGGNGPKPLA